MEEVVVLPCLVVVEEHQEGGEEGAAFHPPREAGEVGEYLTSCPWNLEGGLEGVVEGTCSQGLAVVVASSPYPSESWEEVEA